MKKIYFTIAMALLLPLTSLAQGWPANYGGVMLQGFFWDSYKEKPDCSPWGPGATQGNDATEHQKPGYTWATMYGAGWTSGEEWQVPVTTWSSLLAHKEEITPYIDLLWLPQSGSTIAPATTTYYTSNDNSGRGGVRPWRKGMNWGYTDGMIITNPDCMGFVPVFYFHHGMTFNDDNTPWTYNYNGEILTPMSYFGTEPELRNLISTFKDEGTGAIEDVVANHRGGFGTWLNNPTPQQLIDFPVEWYKGTFCPEGEFISWTSDDVCSDDECKIGQNVYYPGTGNPDCGGKGEWARDIDHHSPVTQQKVLKFLDFLKNDLGYVGYRYDYAMGFEEKHFAEYNTTLRPTFSVGEYWGSKENISSWIHKTYMEGTYQSAAFDFPLQSDIREAFNYGNYRYLNNSGLISDPVLKRYAVTFLDNHDTFKDLPTDGSNYNWSNGKAYQHRVEKNIVEANAFILAMPGTPCLFYPHFMHPQWHDILCLLIKARRTAGITNESERSAATLVGDNGIQWVVTGANGQVCYQLGEEAVNSGCPSGFTTVFESSVARYSITSSLYDQIANNEKKNLINGYPVIDRNSCTFSGSITVNVKPSTEGCTLVYTTNGNDPQAGDNTITASTPLTISDNTTLKVGVLVDGAVPKSSIVIRQYVKTSTESNKINFYVKDDNAPYFYVYYTDNNGTTSEPLGGWRGTLASEKVKVGGLDWWHVQMDKPEYPVSLIINWDGSQTPDIDGITSDVFYTVQDGQPNNVTNTYMPLMENPDLAIDKPTGTYEGSVTATITASYSGATIVYTLDGTEPTVGSPTINSGHSETFATTGNHYLRAGIVKDGQVVNQVARSYYVENGTGPVEFNGVRVFVRADKAPKLYVFDVNGDAPADGQFTQWGGKLLTDYVTDERNYNWYYAVFEGMNSCKVVLNNGNGSQTEDIVNVSGNTYLIYNGSNYYLNVTGLTDHNSYLLFEPSIYRWAKDGAVMQIYVQGVGDNMGMTKIGGTNGGNPIYLWSDDTHDVANETSICFKRKNPNDLNDQWAWANQSYYKGGYYYDDNVDWNDHVQRSDQVDFLHLKYPTELPNPEEETATVIPSCATTMEDCQYFYFENGSFGSPYAWVFSNTKTFGEHGWPGEALVEVVGTAPSGNLVYRWTYPNTGNVPSSIIFSNNGQNQVPSTSSDPFPFVNGGYYTTDGLQGMAHDNIKSLADAIKNDGNLNKDFIISNDIVAVYVDQKGQKRLFAKDADGEALNISRNADGKKIHPTMTGWTYDQSNWVEIILPGELQTTEDLEMFTNKTLLGQTIVGKITNIENPTIEVGAYPIPTSKTVEYTPNNYVAANFMPADYAPNAEYFLVEPKPQEYATIKWAVYHDDKFYVPEKSGGESNQAYDVVIEGAVPLSSDNSYYDQNGEPNFVDGAVYTLTVIIKHKGSPAGAPHLMAEGEQMIYGSAVANNWEVAIVKAEQDSPNVWTPISTVDAGHEVARVRYYNLMGVESSTPFQGVNIIVKEYTDGTSSTTKVIR